MLRVSVPEHLNVVGPKLSLSVQFIVIEPKLCVCKVPRVCQEVFRPSSLSPLGNPFHLNYHFNPWGS